MAFSQDNSAATSALKPEGRYETIITSVDEKTYKSGSKSLSFRLTIRNDVEGQKYGNACLFHQVWKAKEPTKEDLVVNGYTFGRLMAVGKAAKLTDGKEYKDLAEYCDDLIGKCVIAVLKHEKDKNGVDREVTYLEPTQHPDCKHKFKTAVTADTVSAPKNESFAVAATAEAATEDDGDYPF